MRDNNQYIAKKRRKGNWMKNKEKRMDEQVMKETKGEAIRR